jgi:hypothetical protein
MLAVFAAVSSPTAVANMMVVVSTTVIVVVVALFTGSVFGSESVSFESAAFAARRACAWPIQKAAAPLREMGALEFAAGEIHSWGELYKGEAVPYGNRTRNKGALLDTNSSQDGEINLTAAADWRCDPIRAETAEKDQSPNCAFAEPPQPTPKFDAYFASRHSAFWWAVRAAYVAVLIITIFLLRGVIRWVIFDQMMMSVAYITHDVLTRPGSFWREDESRPYANQSPGLVSFVYASLTGCGVILRFAWRMMKCLWWGAGSAAEYVDSLGLGERMLVNARRYYQPVGRRDNDARRVGAGPHSPLQNVVAYAVAQGMALAVEAAANEREHGRAGTNFNGKREDYERRSRNILHALCSRRGDLVLCLIGITSDPKNMVAATLECAVTLLGENFVVVKALVPTPSDSAIGTQLSLCELSTLTFAPMPPELPWTELSAPAAGIAPYSEAHVAEARAAAAPNKSADTTAIARLQRELEQSTKSNAKNVRQLEEMEARVARMEAAQSAVAPAASPAAAPPAKHNNNNNNNKAATTATSK